MDFAQAKEAFRARMEGYSGYWGVAGGWALDLFLGRQTRPHEDLEVIVLRDEHEKLFKHFQKFGAQTIVSTEPPTFAIWQGGEIHPDTIQIRLDPIPTYEGPIEFDLLLTPSDKGYWICRRDETIKKPLTDVVKKINGIYCLAPEIVLLFKAKYMREKDEDDFREVKGRIDKDKRAWLKTALKQVHPGHEWIERL